MSTGVLLTCIGANFSVVLVFLGLWTILSAIYKCKSKKIRRQMHPDYDEKTIEDLFLSQNELCVPDKDRLNISSNTSYFKRNIYDKMIVRNYTRFDFLPSDCYDWETLSDNTIYVRNFKHRCRSRDNLNAFAKRLIKSIKVDIISQMFGRMIKLQPLFVFLSVVFLIAGITMTFLIGIRNIVDTNGQTPPNIPATVYNDTTSGDGWPLVLGYESRKIIVIVCAVFLPIHALFGFFVVRIIFMLGNIRKYDEEKGKNINEDETFQRYWQKYWRINTMSSISVDVDTREIGFFHDETTHVFDEYDEIPLIPVYYPTK